MKILASIIFVVSTSAFASSDPNIQCGAILKDQAEGKIELSLPYMEASNVGGYLFGIDTEPAEDMANNLCKMCNWGTKSTVISILPVDGKSNILAILNSHGKFEQIGDSTNTMKYVDSITCE